ncbi:hypothetical protein PG996_006089 [Apiospora saccharicola]|uniref:Uncharacterized protein n=1 Tax=Apiospora saccharicola TaxID=335842 RepID=A0ABR1VR20_9PEZI
MSQPSGHQRAKPPPRQTQGHGDYEQQSSASSISTNRSQHQLGDWSRSDNNSLPNSRCSSEKSYLRPTTSSTNRAKETKRAATTPSQPQRTLSKDNNGVRAHVSRSLTKAKRSMGSDINSFSSEGHSETNSVHTSASSSHEERFIANWDISQDWDQTQGQAEAHSEHNLENHTEHHTEHHPTAAMQEEPARKRPVLEEQTRLHYNRWKEESHVYVRVPSEFGWQILTTAHELAKGALHDFAREHLPRLWKDMFKGGRHEVRLEADTIPYYLAYWNIQDTTEIYEEYFAHALQQVRKLRNAVSHFSGQYWDGDEYDEHLQYAQALAVAVGDASRAEGVRALRDQLRVVAEDTQTDIEALGLASIIPVPREWEPHHESFFRKFLSMGHGDPGTTINGFEYPPTVVLALENWQWQQDTDEQGAGEQDTGE